MPLEAPPPTDLVHDDALPPASSSPEDTLALERLANLRALKRMAAIALVFLCLAVCYVSREILIPVTLSLLLSLLLSPIVTGLEKSRVPRAVGGFAVLALLLGLAVGTVVMLAEPARTWIATAPNTVKTIQQRFAQFHAPLREAQEASKKIDSLATPADVTPVKIAPPSMLEGVATGTLKMLGTIGAIVLLVYFFLASGNGFLRRLVEIAPRLTDKKMVVSIAREVQDEMSGYLSMVSMINVALGALTSIAMALLGVPNALLFGAMAAVLNFAPYIGPATTGLVLFVVGLTTFPTLGHALAVPGAFFLIAFIEGQLVTPILIGKKLALDPAVVFVWLLMWGWIWGMAGVLLAGPMIACLRIVCQHVDSMNALGVLISDGAKALRGQAAAAADSPSSSAEA